MTVSRQQVDQNIPKYIPHTSIRRRFIVFQGRGDDVSYYGRLGHRLAFDGYAVYVPHQEVSDTQVAARLWNAAVEDWDQEGPLIGLTVDTAAGFLTQALEDSLLHRVPSGLVLTGIGLRQTSLDITEIRLEHDERSQRSACPIHGAVVEEATAANRIIDSQTVPITPVLPSVSDADSTLLPNTDSVDSRR